MLGSYGVIPQNRVTPRIPVETFCSELDDETMRHAMIVDLSPGGLRMQRPIGGRRTRDLQLEFEIPEVDEVVWAQGRVCFDEVWRLPAVTPGKLSGVVRTSGVKIVGAASRHQRLLREWVMDTWRAREAEDNWLMRASCYLRG